MLSYRSPDPDTLSCIELAHLTIPNFTVLYRSGLAVHIARSLEATRFLENYGGDEDVSEYLIFIDDDMTFAPIDLNKLVEHMRNGYHCIGGLAPTRDGLRLASKGKGNTLKVDGEIHEASMLGTGFMGVTRTLLRRLVEELKLPRLEFKFQNWNGVYPFFVFEYGFGDNAHQLFSADYEFCRKITSIGEKMYLDTSIQIGHIGKKLYTVEDALVNQGIKVTHREP